MTTAIYWFRNDLRLSDNPALVQACKDTDFLLPVYILESESKQDSLKNYPNTSDLRSTFLQESLHDLRAQLRALGSDLFEFRGDYIDVLQGLGAQLKTNIIYCEQIFTCKELGVVSKLKKAGFKVKSFWQSSMLAPDSLPFELIDMPDVFTQFRLKVEKHKLKFTNPVETLMVVSPLPTISLSTEEFTGFDTSVVVKSFAGGESKAVLHIEQYFKRRLVDSYKKTRNQLIGMDYSSKFSPWLSLGCCSARSIAKQLIEYEYLHGPNEGTYWLWFELLWRDYFRFLYIKKLTKNSSLTDLNDEPRAELCEAYSGIKFKRWSRGYTGDSFVDAGMRELLATGYLSNRMRQVVASYWIYNLNGHWEVGEAWFRSQLLDYDIYSNERNWQYIAGNGKDHQGGRQFNIAKQTQDHDPDGIYRTMWST